ncbi:MAG: NUDIX domain-containing protein [Armatimonadota bacterium]|nr:NUDIX domain-containing protein [Armatimonadota bacterium]
MGLLTPRPHPDGPTAVYLRTLVFVFHGDHLLLIFRERPPDAGMWNAIGGKINRGEDPLDAARRELQEEAGIEPSLTFRGVATVVVQSTGEHWVIFLFSGEVGDRAVTPSPEGALRWASPAELAALPVLPDIPLLAPYMAGTRRVILAKFTYAAPGLETVESFVIRG